MCFEVSGERGFHGEGSVTLRAFIGLLMRVYPDVTHQVARLLKLLSTVSTLVPANTVYLQLYLVQ